MTDAVRGHRRHPHTADVILEAWGPDFDACCAEAITAVLETCIAQRAGTPRPVVTLRRRLARANATDGDLLLDALDETVFVLDTADGIPVGVVVRSHGDELDLDFDLVDPTIVEGTGAVPKAISRSEFEFETGPTGVSCRFLVDV